MLQVMSIFGTRPEAIKMAPVVRALEAHPDLFQSRVVVTAQHREMLDQVLNLFEIKPDADLNIMDPDQTLTGISVKALKGLEPLFLEKRPHLVLLQGDTSTAFIAALAAFYQQIPVGHVEAGLRTHDPYDPFPEEMNRRLISVISSLNFAPTPLAEEQLLAGGVSRDGVYLTGNTVIDALHYILEHDQRPLPSPLAELDWKGRRVLLVETHRRENLGAPMKDICLGLQAIVERFPDVEMVVSVHRNPRVREVVMPALCHHSRIHLLDPVEYPVLIKLMKQSHFILTDSGGIQEEAPALGKPVLVLRRTTERPEGVEAGTARVVGTDPQRIFEEAARLLSDPGAYASMSRAANPYGDGRAAERIVEAILHRFGKRPERPLPFTPQPAQGASSPS